MTAKQLRAQKSNMFATRKSIDEVLKDANANETILVMIAINTTLEIIAKNLEE